ncbi:FHA domain-containing protein [Nocardioides sp. JQ2195]|uniref:FHA domain-containing protein n=1 Tax=Nocardioides sp. JQ2195 TaxID=2592334 RepID=UPI00143E8BED|nr:FHA domain-containing protein [Nocardioides sp. JQ2195]QIX27158.1 FHA domain-containing protein [Nocardioides sp. JQ2195]
MSRRLQISADLRVTVDLPDGGSARGHLRGSGRSLTLEVDRPEVFASPGDAASLAELADALCRRGIRLDVTDGKSILLRIGDVRASWWHRRLTGSRHIRLGSLRSLVAPGRARLRPRGRGAVLPDRALVPPATLLPIAPTFQRRPKRVITTTHDVARGGQPRLVLAEQPRLVGVSQRVTWLRDGVTTIGSGDDCDLRIEGLAALHAEVVHDEADELVLVARAGGVRVNGATVDRQLLRTGCRVDIGDTTLVFSREEYADHGRPYGGRIGGELGHQQPQPPRTVLQGDS